LDNLFNFSFENYHSALVSFIPAWLNWCILIFILLKLPKTPVSNFFALFVASLAAWETNEALLRVSNSAETALLWNNILGISVMFVPAFGLHFVLHFTERKKVVSSKLGIFLLYLPVFLYYFLARAHLLPDKMEFIPKWGWQVKMGNLSDPQTLISIIIVIWIFALLFAIFILLAIYAVKLKNNKERSLQALLIASGFSFPVIFGFFTQIFPLIFKVHTGINLTSATIPVFSITTLIALTRYNLFRELSPVFANKIIEAIMDMVLIVDHSGKLQYINLEGAVDLGVDRDNTENFYIHDFFPVENDCRKNFIENVWDKVLNDNIVKGYSTKCINSNKGEFSVFISASTIVLDGISEKNILLVIRDISEQIAVQEKLIKSEKMLSKAQKIARIGNWEFNTQTNSALWSAEIYNMYGVSPESFIPSLDNFLALVHPEDRDFVIEAQAKVFKKEIGSAYFKHRVIRSDNSVRTLYAQIESELDENGNLIRLFGVNHDITELTIAEQALEEHKEQLRQSQKLEAIGTLAGGIAHDFNNLLTVINGYSSFLLQKVQKDTSIYKQISEINKAGESATQLTKQLLAFSRKQILETQVLDINVVVKNLNNMLERLIREEIELSVNLEEKIALIKSDPGQIEQIIINLIVNAGDAINKNGLIKIETATVFLDETFAGKTDGFKPGNFVKLVISDNGSGIKPEIVSRIFEPFFTTKEKGRGTGLGLSTVYGIIQQSGGYLTLNSIPDQGTTFSIYFPECTDSAEKVEEPINNLFEKGSEVILLVEDDDSVREFTKNILQQNGYKVFDSKNASEALMFLENGKDKVDLVITDVIMPQISGGEFDETLYKNFPDIKVLFISGYTDDILSRQGILGYKDRLLEKPFTEAKLISRIREILDQRMVI
jgi:PAS domain S-box-containing protein